MTQTMLNHPAGSTVSDLPWTVVESPIGPLTLAGGPAGLSALEFPGRGPQRREEDRDPAAFDAPRRQLEEYFTGRRIHFELALDLHGTPFQLEIWRRLRGIAFGATDTYGALAAALGRPDRARAVGAAVGRTPVPIIVPCHRVIGADGQLTGYGGGLQRKQFLLDHEAAVSHGEPAPGVWRGRQLSLV